MKKGPETIRKIYALAGNMYVSSCSVKLWENEHNGTSGYYLQTPDIEDCIIEAEKVVERLEGWFSDKLKEVDTEEGKL